MTTARRRALFAAAAALATISTVAPAQSSPLDSLVRVGARISYRRWRTDAAPRRMSEHVNGTVAERVGDTLRVQMANKDTVVSVDLRSLASLDVSIERHHHPIAGSIIGFGVGGLLAIASSAFGDSHCSASGVGLCEPGAGTVITMLAVGTGIGAVIGGAAINHEQWVHVIPAPSR